MAFFFESYEILHAEYISALKTEPKSMVFEKHAKSGKKIFIIIIFYFFVIFSKSLNQKWLIPTESCFLDGKKPNIANLVDINSLADNEKKLPGYRLCKNGRVNGFFSANHMKMCLFGYFCMQNSFRH